VTKYSPPYKTLFFLCYSAVAATVATEAGLLSNPDSYVARQSHEAFVDDYESYLADNEEHPWCGTGRMDDVQVGFLVDDGKGGHQFITEDEYKELIAEMAEEV
jgi:hypothetical protein